MAITRRQFLKRTGLATAGTLLGPSLFGNALRPRGDGDTIGNRYLVVIYPRRRQRRPQHRRAVLERRAAHRVRRLPAHGRRRDQPLAGRARRRPPSAPIPATGTQLALASRASPGLKQLYDLGKVAVVQGCGYPDYSLSHDESRSIWQTANPLGLGAYAGTGWVGRHLRPGEYSGDATSPASASASEVAPEFRQTATSVLAINRLRGLRLSRTTTSATTTSRPRKRDGLPGALRHEARRRGAADPQLHRRQRRRDAAQQRELPAARTTSTRRTARRPFSDALRRRRPQHRARPARDREDHLRRRSSGAARTSTRASSS